MKELLQNLLKLQALEFDETFGPETEKQMDDLCAKIPPRIIAHHDRLLAQGKKGMAAVRNQVCSGCHVHVTRALVLALMQEKDIQTCANCGRFLYLPQPAAPESSQRRKLGKTAGKSGARQELLHAV